MDWKPASLFRRGKKISKRRSSPCVRSASIDASSSSRKDASRYYVASAHERFHNGRYEAIRQLGGGRYSHVWHAKDLKTKSFVALKLLTNDCYGAGHDIFEVEILRRITQEQARLNEQQSSHCVGLLDTFHLDGPAGAHECLVMPLVGCNIIDQANRFQDERIPPSIMKHITRQLLLGLRFLHDRCQVIHTEMVDGDSAANATPTITEDEPGTIQIIDFGVASWVDRHLSNNIQPEHLRAPEVILGAPWGPPVDIWSLGCLVLELTKGHVAFPGAASERGTWTSEDDHLAQYMEVLGPMPQALLETGTRTSEFFDGQGNLLRILTLKWTSLETFLDGNKGPLKRPKDMTTADLLTFADFLKGALTLDPQTRKSADELLRHKWLADVE